jgi:hypothetical protein
LDPLCSVNGIFAGTNLFGNDVGKVIFKGFDFGTGEFNSHSHRHEKMITFWEKELALPRRPRGGINSFTMRSTFSKDADGFSLDSYLFSPLFWSVLRIAWSILEFIANCAGFCSHFNLSMLIEQCHAYGLTIS